MPPRIPQKEGPRIGGGLATISQDCPEIADQSLGLNGARFLGPNRGWGWSIFGVAPSPTSGRLKCADIGESLAAIRPQKEALPDLWRIGHDSPTIVRKSRAIVGN